MNYAIFLTIFYIFGLILGNFSQYYIFSILVIPIIFIFRNYFGKIFSIILVFIFFLGLLNCSLRNKTDDKLFDIGYKNNVTLKGRIISIPENIKENNKIRFYFKADNIKYENKLEENINSKTYVTINSPKNISDLKIGNIIKIKGKLRIPISANNPYQFDYSKYLKRKNVFTTFYSENNSYVLESKPTKKDFMWRLISILDLQREKIVVNHSKYLKSPNLEVLCGMVFGNDTINPPDNIKENFKNSGLLHLLAASGLNVALIFAIWWFFGTRLNLGNRLTIIIGIFLIILYSLMTGCPPSILRASLMLLFILIGKLFDMEADSLSLVFFVGLIILVINPNMLYDVGFELSFIVTIGLIFGISKIVNSVKFLDEKYKNLIKNKPRFLNKFYPTGIIGTFLTPIFAQLSVAPLQLYYFNTFTPYSFPANIAIIPFIGLASFFGFVSSICSMIGLNFIVKFLDILVNPIVGIIIKISDGFANIENSILYFPSPNIFQIILYYLILTLLLFCIFEKFKNRRKNILVVVLSIIFFLSFIKIPNNNFKILAFDVGNSDSFLITTPNNKHILIDTGKLPYRGKSQAEFIINVYLRNKNVRKLDYLILTHFDIDHVGGAYDISKNFQIGKIIIENKKPDNMISKKFLELNKNKNIQKANSNEVIYREPNFKITTFALKNGKENETSIITLIEYENIKALFMGDADSKIYRKFEKQIPKNIDILKVGHHGAKESIDDYMLDRLKPKMAIISTGFNTYGHPHISTLITLRKHKVFMFSTKELGAIEFNYIKNKKIFEIFSYKHRIKKKII